MPKLTVNGNPSDVETGKRLVLAIEELGIAIGHRCGGFAKCTTCRVEFVEGGPETMTRAEYDKLKESGIFGQVRLSCQIVCDRDMHVRPLRTSENQPQWEGDTGPAPAPNVTPEPVWFPIETLEKQSL